jgi:hypothetical protein
LVYSTYLGGTYDSSRGPEQIPDYGQGIAVDANGSAYVTGYTGTLDFPTKNAFQATLKGFADAFVTKFEACGCALVYSTYLGGSSGASVGYGIAVDAEGSAYVTGGTGSTDFPIKNAFQEIFSGGGDVFVTKFDALGNLAYSTYWGEGGSERGRGIAVDTDGNAYVTGASYSFGGGDAFVIKLDATGDALVYSTYLGGSGDGDTGNGIAVDARGNAYVTGSTNSPDFPTRHASQATLVGNKDAFVAKIRAHPGQPR